MIKIYFLSLFLFIQTNSQIEENPICLVNSTNPFVLSTNDDYYYVITIGKNLKIKKESGIIENITDNGATVENYIFISDISYNNYIYIANIYFKIIYNPFISYEKIKIEQESIYPNMTTAGFISINNTNDIIIYGYYNNDYLINLKSSKI